MNYMLICTGIALGSVLLVEIVKNIVKHCAKKKGKEINMKKAEYLLAVLPILTTFAGIYIFMKYESVLTVNEILKLCSIFAGSTQTIYTFGVQLVRKGFVGIVSACKFVFTKKNSNQDITDQAKEVINNMTEVNEGKKVIKSENETFDDFLERLGK